MTINKTYDSIYPQRGGILMFKLTDEQVNYIIEYYGSSKPVIKDIERRLNLLGVVEDEDDYFEIVATVAAQKETIKEQMKKCSTPQDVFRYYLSTNQLIIYTLNEKYNDFINANPEVQEKMKSYC